MRINGTKMQNVTSFHSTRRCIIEYLLNLECEVLNNFVYQKSVINSSYTL